MKHTGDYIISGGLEGKKRLNILSDILHPYTLRLLKANGLATGTAFLDAGCGGGNVAVMASAVARRGRVTAVDFDADIIALNREEAAARSITNIQYLSMDAYGIDFHNEFDIAYSRFLLSHLQDPLRALQNLVRSIKPGGRIVVEDVHFSGHFCYPDNTAFEHYVSLYTALAASRRQNAEIGPALPSLFAEAGIADIGFDVIQPVFNTGQSKWMAFITLDKIKESVIAAGLGSQSEIKALLEELEHFTRDENTLISLPRIFRAWGTRR